MTDFFTTVPEPIRYEGPESDNPLAFRWYDADRVVGDKTMAEHLRMDSIACMVWTFVRRKGTVVRCK